MPGSEGGDRVHNFFDQEKFKHQHPHAVDESRVASSGFHWSGNQRQGSSQLNFSLEHSAPDLDRGNSDRNSSLVRGSPFSQSPQRPNFIVNPKLKKHTNFNGYIHDHSILQAKHDQTNYREVSIEPNHRNPFSRELFTSEAPYGNGSEQFRDTRLEPNFNLLGSHQNMNNQQLGMLQSSPRQHAGLNERQLLQQQAVLRNMYEVQRQQQLESQDGRQTYSANHLSGGQQKAKDRPPDYTASLNNTTSFKDGSDFALMTQQGVQNPNWLGGVMSVPGNGIPSAEQRTSAHMIGCFPQPIDQSIHGFPVFNTRGSPNHYSNSMEKPLGLSQQVPSEGRSADQYGTQLGQVNTLDRDFGSRSDFQGNSHLSNPSNKGSFPGTLGKSSPVGSHSQQRNPSMKFQGSQGMLNSNEKMVTQTGPLQDAAPLDPTEEKFLFGSDDNIWDAFGKSSNSGPDDYNTVESSEFQSTFLSMQSGSWSALMQSALAETCSKDTGNQEGWSGLNVSSKPASVAHEPLTYSNRDKQSRTSVTYENSDKAPSLNAEQHMPFDKSRVANTHSAQGLSLSSLKSSYDVNERFQSNSVSKSGQHISEGSRWSNQSNLKGHLEENQINNSYGLPVATQNMKDASGAWVAQHGTIMNDSGSQAYNKYVHFDHIGSEPGEESTSHNIYHLQEKQKVFMHEEIQKDNSAWTRNSFPNSPASMGPLNPKSCIETAPTISSLFDSRNVNQKPPSSHLFNGWKHVGSTPELRNENKRSSHHPLEAHPHFLSSSVNSLDKDIQVSRTGDYGSHANSSFVQQSCFRDNTSSDGVEDAIMSCQSDNDSENMVEPLNKTDQPRENSAVASRNSSVQNMLSRKHAAESPDSSMSHLQQNQSSGFHTYGLQLSPLHQRFPTQSHDTCQRSSQAPNSVVLNSGQLLQCGPANTSPAEPHGALHGFVGQSGNAVSVHNVQESSVGLITSVFPSLRNQHQNQQIDTVPNKNDCMSTNIIASHLDHSDDMLAKASPMQLSVGPPLNALGSNINHDRPKQGSFHVGLPWTNVPKQQTSSSTMPHKGQPKSSASESHMKTSVIPQLEKDYQNSSMRGPDLTGPGARDSNSAIPFSMEDQQAIERSSKFGLPDVMGLPRKSTSILGTNGFLSSGDVTHQTCEPSRTKKSETEPQNSYSLLHQLQVMRSTETDPNNRDFKRLKGQDASSDAQQSPSKSGQHLHTYSPKVTEISKLALSRDSKLPNLTSELGNQSSHISPQHESMQYQNMPSVGWNDTSNHHHSSHIVSSTPQISPQMAPSWFERYGSFTREQLVLVADVWNKSLSRPPEPARALEKSSTSIPGLSHGEQILSPSAVDQFADANHSSAPEPFVVEQSSSSQLTAPTTSHGLVSGVPHEAATLEPAPWHKEVIQDGLRGLPNISASEVKWASAAKRVPDKIFDEVERAEDRTVMLNHKRRVVLTTQLLQQLLEPSPASVMSLDAYMNYESVIYFTSRESCASACSLSCSKNPCIKFTNHNNMTPKMPKQGDNLLSRVEDFLIRTAKLENTLSSLEMQTLILDLRTEWQDIEKFSVINRFAKFHGRGQADGSATMNAQSDILQRYVTALPSPRNLPDTVQCLSL